MSQVAKPAQWKGAAVFPDGRQFRPIGEHFLAAIIPLPGPKSILEMPDSAKLFPLGKDANKPIVWGKVIAVGPKCNTLQPGDIVLIHPLNTNERKIGGVSYYIPREKAVYCTVDGAE